MNNCILKSKFGRELLDLSAKRIKEESENEDIENKRIKERNFMNFLISGKSQQKSVWDTLSRDDKFIIELFYKFSEISETLDRIKITSVLIKQYPARPSWKKARITKSLYLRYNFDNFLAEVYILSERFKSLLNFIIKKSRECNLESDSKKMATLKKIFLDRMDSINKTRGLHTHSTRYTDNELDQVGALELLNLPELNPLKELHYRTKRLELSKTIIEVHKNIISIMTLILDERVYDTVFKKIRPLLQE